MIPLLVPAALLGCRDPEPAGEVVTGRYAVTWSTDPSPAVAGEEVAFTLTVTGPDGEPVQDLQTNHERLVHTLFVGADLRSFQHLHQEDVRPVTADDLRAGTFSFPVTFPSAGRYRIAFDYAHQNVWLQTLSEIEVEGAPAMAPEPDLSGGPVWEGQGVAVALGFDAPPAVGGTSTFELTFSEAGGEPVTDLVQYLGADGHCVVASAGEGGAPSTWVSHTHAWSPGMEDMAPNMEMPALYPGPTMPFHLDFPVAGDWRMWCQVCRRSLPGEVVTATWPLEVGG